MGRLRFFLNDRPFDFIRFSFGSQERKGQYAAWFEFAETDGGFFGRPSPRPYLLDISKYILYDGVPSSFTTIRDNRPAGHAVHSLTVGFVVIAEGGT